MRRIILGIETAVDETAVAVVEDGWRVRASKVSSQVSLHARYGGVVPEVAARDHVRQIIPVLDSVIREAEISLEDVDAVAVSTTPGLLIALLIGIETAKTIAYVHGKPLISINDVEAHAYANWVGDRNKFITMQRDGRWPKLFLIVSGGTTAIVVARSWGRYDIIAQTRDDAVGEAYDKVARYLGLGFPGGPVIDRRSSEGNGRAYDLPRPMADSESLDLSFSGLKTAVVRLVKELGGEANLAVQAKNDICASFQEAVVETLALKVEAALATGDFQEVAVGGGVAANSRLREVFGDKFRIPVHFPPLKYCTDNAAMGAGCAYFYYKNKIFTPLEEMRPFVYKDMEGNLCRY